MTPTPVRPSSRRRTEAGAGSSEGLRLGRRRRRQQERGSATAPEISAAAVTRCESSRSAARRRRTGARRVSRSRKAAKPTKARKQERRFRQTVQRIDLWSVTKMALCFYVSAMAVRRGRARRAVGRGRLRRDHRQRREVHRRPVLADDFHFVSAEVLRGRGAGRRSCSWRSWSRSRSSRRPSTTSSPSSSAGSRSRSARRSTRRSGRRRCTEAPGTLQSLGAIAQSVRAHP